MIIEVPFKQFCSRCGKRLVISRQMKKYNIDSGKLEYVETHFNCPSKGTMSGFFHGGAPDEYDVKTDGDNHVVASKPARAPW